MPPHTAWVAVIRLPTYLAAKQLQSLAYNRSRMKWNTVYHITHKLQWRSFVS